MKRNLFDGFSLLLLVRKEYNPTTPSPAQLLSVNDFLKACHQLLVKFQHPGRLRLLYFGQATITREQYAPAVVFTPNLIVEEKAVKGADPSFRPYFDLPMALAESREQDLFLDGILPNL